MNNYLNLMRSQIYCIEMNLLNIEDFHEKNNIYEALGEMLKNISILEHISYKNSLEYQMSRPLPQEKL